MAVLGGGAVSHERRTSVDEVGVNRDVGVIQNTKRLEGEKVALWRRVDRKVSS